MKRCSHCDTMNLDDARICYVCHKSLLSEHSTQFAASFRDPAEETPLRNITCPNCGAVNTGDAKFCKNCQGSLVMVQAERKAAAVQQFSPPEEFPQQRNAAASYAPPVQPMPPRSAPAPSYPEPTKPSAPANWSGSSYGAVVPAKKSPVLVILLIVLAVFVFILAALIITSIYKDNHNDSTASITAVQVTEASNVTSGTAAVTTAATTAAPTKKGFQSITSEYKYTNSRTDDQAKSLFYAAVPVLADYDFSNMDYYFFDWNDDIDSALRAECPFVDDYQQDGYRIMFFTIDNELKSVCIVRYDETNDEYKLHTYPLPVDEDNFEYGGPLWYSPLWPEDKITVDNNAAEKLGHAIEAALVDLQEAGTPMEDGEYTLENCGDLKEALSAYVELDDVQYNFEDYYQVQFEIYTNDDGDQQCAVIVSISGEYCGAYPHKTIKGNTTGFTLEKAKEQ